MDLEPGEKCFCSFMEAYRKNPCGNWVSEDSPELGEQLIADKAIEEEVWVNGMARELQYHHENMRAFIESLDDQSIDQWLDDILSREDYSND